MKKKLLAAAVVLTAVKKAVFILQKMVTFSGSAWKRMKAAAIPKRNF